jgi:hypothetical protein
MAIINKSHVWQYNKLVKAVKKGKRIIKNKGEED